MKEGRIILPTWQKHMEREIASKKIDLELGYLLADIAFVGSRIGNSIRQYGLKDNITGSTNHLNMHGEHVKKLDLYAHHLFVEMLKKNRYCAAIVSEEAPDVILTGFSSGKYLVFIDPLDGSSNIENHVSTGSIFSVYEKRSMANEITKEDVLQAGNNQVAAGYFLYSSSTMMVYSAGHEVNGFTFCPEEDTFYFTHENITLPANAGIYSVNVGNESQFPEYVQTYLKHCRMDNGGIHNTLSLRYVGSMVADMHRNLLKGGIFLYPATLKNPHGKLRLMYECNPFAYLIEKAGGRATDGRYTRILDKLPSNIHERCSIVIGSKEMMVVYENFVPVEDTLVIQAKKLA